MGFNRNPFRHITYASADLARVRTTTEMTIADRALTVIAGPRGVGKTHAVTAALPNGAQIVRVLAPDKERLRVGAIEDAMIYDLAPSESPKRSKEGRARQVRRILGEAAQRGPVVVVIEEAHALHSATLRSLKRLRELAWMGKSPLFSCLLIGQRDMLSGAGLDELKLRSDVIWCSGLSAAEAEDYARNTVGRVFEDDAVTAVANAQAARNYLELQAALVAAMGHAAAEGRRVVQLHDVYQAIGAGLRELAKALGVTQAEIARQTGLSPTQVTRVLSNEREQPEHRAAIADVLERYRPGAKAAAAEPAPRQAAAS
jgi:type II secretory pathway predicted ATPase ExeA